MCCVVVIVVVLYCALKENLLVLFLILFETKIINYKRLHFTQISRLVVCFIVSHSLYSVDAFIRQCYHCHEQSYFAPHSSAFSFFISGGGPGNWGSFSWSCFAVKLIIFMEKLFSFHILWPPPISCCEPFFFSFLSCSAFCWWCSRTLKSNEIQLNVENATHQRNWRSRKKSHYM